MTVVFAFMAWMAMHVGLGILVLIHGWGLEPQSWWWIVGAGYFLSILSHSVGQRIARDFGKLGS